MSWVRDHLEKCLDAWGGIGVSVAVVRGDHIICAEGAGRRRVDRPGAVDADTLFQVGSTTKAFTAAAVGVLVEEERLDWDEPIARLLPLVQSHAAPFMREITLRDALAHRSGLPISIYPFLRPMSPSEALTLLCACSPIAPFRASYQYNNLIYALAGAALEVVAGVNWHEFVRTRLLAPAGMTRSETTPYRLWPASEVAPVFLGAPPSGRWMASDAYDRNLAMPHACDAREAVTVLPWVSYDVAAAAGSIVSSAYDMARWLTLHLNDGTLDGRQLLAPQTVCELHSTQNSYSGAGQFPLEQAGETYALGWRRATHRGHVHLSHGGGMIGFPAYVAMLPVERLGVVVLSNGSRWAAGGVGLNKAIAFAILDRLLGHGDMDWSDAFLSRARSERQPLAARSDELAQPRCAPFALEPFCGVYEDVSGGSGRVEVLVDGDGLALRFEGVGAFRARLVYRGDEAFELELAPGVKDVLGRQLVRFKQGRGGAFVLSLFDAELKQTAQASSANKAAASGSART